jgi:hypothetical protein
VFTNPQADGIAQLAPTKPASAAQRRATSR